MVVLLKNRVWVKISKKGLIEMLTSINFKTNVEAAIQLYVHPALKCAKLGYYRFYTLLHLPHHLIATS